MKEREGLDSKNEELSQKGDKAKQGLRKKKSHFWVRVRAFYVWREKKRNREEEKKRRRKKEGEKRSKSKYGTFCWNLFCMESTYVWIISMEKCMEWYGIDV